MSPVIVPIDVAEAFNYHQELWKTMPIDDQILMLMSIPFSRVNGQSLILKEYGKRQPRLYLHAVLYGYITKNESPKEAVELLDDVNALAEKLSLYLPTLK